MSSLGRELRICPARRPGVVFAFVALLLGAGFAALAIALHAGSGTSSDGDRTFVSALAVIFLAFGALLLFLGQRKRRQALVFRIFEQGVARETSTSRQELRFSELAKLLVRALRINQGPTGYTIHLIARDGATLELPSHSIDNVDESLITLLAQQSGIKPEPLSPRAR
ncbi:MAG: hypothetical protein EOO73_28285 [Myxococcales bacterium]|nr:MAG: hypothetical protein EOO73_28285 [Myxococcales bacterium]